MLGQPFALEVTVAQAGYRVADSNEIALSEQSRVAGVVQRWILERPPAQGRSGVRSRTPDDEDPILYRTFAALKADQESDLLKFADQWGYLCWGRRFISESPTGPSKPPQGLTYTESLDLWRTEIAKLKHAIRVHEAVRDGDREWLASQMQFIPEERHKDTNQLLEAAEWQFRTHVTNECDAQETMVRGRYGLNRSEFEISAQNPWCSVELGIARLTDDVRTVASAWLDHEISSELLIAPQAGFEFSTHERTSTRGIRVRPSDLCSLMWWQFARSVELHRQERACRECGKWFILNPKDRDRKFFCSESCKTKNFRGRKKQAAELHASGEHTLEAIAEATLSDVETVRNWLGIKETGRRIATKRK